MNYTEALNNFVETIRVNSLEYYKKTGLTHLVDNPEVIKVNKGRRFDKVVRGTSVYCFVEKETGFIFKAATWRAPQLKTKNPVRGSIYEIDTYEGKAGPYGSWLYQ
tara:strand:- start:52 stop:369 length:318 start_codon:yes stop_codon:yes gene_type:complete